MDEVEARQIASEYHGGQDSPLYAFASSGYIDPGILGEIDYCINHITEEPTQIDELRTLRSYIHSRQED